jgi:hypothetical protein
MMINWLMIKMECLLDLMKLKGMKVCNLNNYIF